MTRIGVVLVLALVAAGAYGKSVQVPLADVVRQSDLVVHGVLTKIQRTETNDIVSCKGVLQIKEMFKGSPTNAVVLSWEFRQRMSEQTDHTPWRGMQMIWFLSREESEEYSGSAKPMSKKEEVLGILKDKSNAPSQGTPRHVRQP